MANTVYPSGKTALLNDLNLSTADIRIAVFSSSVTYNSAHSHVSDVAAGIVARSGALASKTVVAGVFDAADLVLPAVTGSTITGYVLFEQTGTDSTARLIGFVDTNASGNPISQAVNGSDIGVTFNGSGILSS